MTPKDKKLIQQANSIDCLDWFLVCDLEDQAETEEAREQLATIRKTLYHEEEGFSGVL